MFSWPNGSWSGGNLDSKVEQAGSVGPQFQVRTDVAATTKCYGLRTCSVHVHVPGYRRYGSGET